MILDFCKNVDGRWVYLKCNAVKVAGRDSDVVQISPPSILDMPRLPLERV